jgi:hypothetical protein
MTFLRMLDRLATRGVIWIDLADRPLLNRRQTLELAERVGMDFLRYRRRFGAPLFRMSGRKA